MKLHELTTPNKIQEAIADCLQRKIQLTENVFRSGSDAYFETFRVAREMLAKGQLVIDDNMREMLEQTDIGEFYTMKDGTLLPLDCPMVEEEPVDEAEYQGKDVELNKPKRGGSKKYYVYVKNPKTGKVKKINFGDAGGLTAKINDPAAKRSFVARHKCKQKNDKTKAGYWACRLPRYAKSLGLKGGGAWW